MLSFLIRSVHNNPLQGALANPTALAVTGQNPAVLAALPATTRMRLQSIKDVTGFNLAGLRAVQQHIELAGD